MVLLHSFQHVFKRTLSPYLLLLEDFARLALLLKLSETKSPLLINGIWQQELRNVLLANNALISSFAKFRLQA